MRKYLSIVTLLLLACLVLGAAFLSNEQVTSTKLNNLNNANITAGAGIDLEKLDDTSATTTEQDATADPYVGDAQTLATDAEDEIQQLRFVVEELKQTIVPGAAGTEKWYVTPTTGTQGDIAFHDGTRWNKLAASTDGLYLETNGAGTSPTWTEPTIVSTASGQYARTGAAGSGSQALTGAGFSPKALTVYALVESGDEFSLGFGGGGAEENNVRFKATVWNNDNSNLINISDGTNSMTATLDSLDADGATLTWTKGSAGQNVLFNILYLR